MISVPYCAALIVAYALLALHELHEEPIERISYDRVQL